MQIGCHVSIAQGIFNAPQRAAALGAECFQIFTRSPQGGKTSELTPEIIRKFKTQNSKYKIKQVYVHTPYYINFASLDNKICHNSISIVREELERANLLDAKFVITHLGSAKELNKDKALEKIIKLLKETLKDYTGSAKLLLENSAGAGNIIGNDFKELSKIIKSVKDKNIAGVCLDTQHSFAFGYDWRNAEKTLEIIDAEIGLENIKLIHVNDSLTDCNSKKDRHAHIGEGKIGKAAFEHIVAFAKKNKIDMLLETKHAKITKDIKLLKNFREK